MFAVLSSTATSPQLESFTYNKGMEGCDVSLARGVLGKGDKETGRGDVGVDEGSTVEGSPRVIVDEKGRVGL